ncbi:energy transducer TonB [Paraburkholderia sp. MMS20-SJTN17]|uniref:Energy transducer TonB n=1 Tax=Paraburkholderia translucens TaxID=2886945 RepID=A0ABS8K9J3_9BURK|nr:energy transducer TonB [Paraburkholderia sp. MMS20-SJTN17]MCC8401394.1 energy transducer TonB [Paraburkholderia sp. MMS20-SJTN17]
MTPASSTRPNSRALTTTAVVAAIHVALLGAIMTLRHEPVQAALESRVMTAELLPPAPAALQSIASPPPHPAPSVHSQPTHRPKPAPAPKPAPTPLPQAAAPSATQVAAPDPQPPAPAAPASPPGLATPPAAATPAIGKPTMEISAPRNVSHVECNIAHPDYPTLSKRRHETGIASVRFVIGLTGKLDNIELTKSSGYSRLDDAAVAAMHASACKPHLENGEPVRAAYTQSFNFDLTD